MGFNYLQTDDKDDFFSSLKKQTNKRRSTGITLISPLRKILFDNVPAFKIRTYCKKNYLPIGKSGKYIWREILLSKGYQVVTNY